MASIEVNWIALNRKNIASIRSINSCEGCTFAVHAMWGILGAHPCRVGFQEPVGCAVYKCTRLVTCARLAMQLRQRDW